LLKLLIVTRFLREFVEISTDTSGGPAMARLFINSLKGTSKALRECLLVVIELCCSLK